MIIFNEEVKEKLLQGIDLVADSVSITLGPQARTAILQGNPPIVINDGVTIAKHISHADPYVQMGIQLVQNLANKAQSKAGDGTTTACILARAMCQNIAKTEVTNIHQFRQEIDILRDTMIEQLDSLAIEVDDDSIESVATIAANNDEVLGGLIAKVFSHVGRDGVITVQEGHGLSTTFELKDGLEIDNGFISHLFANQDNGSCILNNPLIVTTNKIIRNFQDILPILEYASTNGNSVFLICKDLQGSALSNVLANVIQNRIEICVIQGPNHGDAQLDELKDIVSVVGGKVFADEAKDSLQIFTKDDFGKCDRVVVDQLFTTLIGGEGDTTERIQAINNLYNEANNDWIRDRLAKRLSRLKGGVAVIHVGGGSSVELRETKERLDDALNATKAALQEGVIVGGGLGLLQAVSNIEGAKPWLVDALMTPINVLLKNGSMSEEEWDNINIRKNIGYNASKGRSENLLKAGVIDPVKVTKSSLTAAMSIASMFLTTEVAVLREE